MRRVIDTGLQTVALVHDSHLQFLFVSSCLLHLKQVDVVEHLLFNLANLALNGLTLLFLFVQLVAVLFVLLGVVCSRYSAVD